MSTRFVLPNNDIDLLTEAIRLGRARMFTMLSSYMSHPITMRNLLTSPTLIGSCGLGSAIMYWIFRNDYNYPASRLGFLNTAFYFGSTKDGVPSNCHTFLVVTLESGRSYLVDLTAYQFVYESGYYRRDFIYLDYLFQYGYMPITTPAIYEYAAYIQSPIASNKLQLKTLVATLRNAPKATPNQDEEVAIEWEPEDIVEHVLGSDIQLKTKIYKLFFPSYTHKLLYKVV